MRTLLVVAGLLAAGAVPLTAAAQHGETAAPAAHATEASKPAARPAPPAQAGAKPVEPKRAAPRSDLEAAFDRIAQKIEGAEVMPGGLRISSGSTGRAVGPRATERRAARAEATTTTRIRLNWRFSVVWPATLDKAGTPDPAPATHESPRITLAWP